MTDNPNATVWENPPQDGAPRQKFTASHPVIVDLRANPGRWARLTEYEVRQTAVSQAHRINAGSHAWSSPAGSFEAATRTVDGAHVIYARYVGEDGTR